LRLSFGLIVNGTRTIPSSRFASQAPQTKSGAMKDARGLDVSANDSAAVAAADDFAARLLRLDQGVEGILEAAKHWSDTPIIQLHARRSGFTANRRRPRDSRDPSTYVMMTSIGGSDAQDDLFRQTYLRSLQAAGRRADAAAYFDRNTANKSLTPLDRVLAN
jgi:hypothetical protein